MSCDFPPPPPGAHFWLISFSISASSSLGLVWGLWRATGCKKTKCQVCWEKDCAAWKVWQNRGEGEAESDPYLSVTVDHELGEVPLDGTAGRNFYSKWGKRNESKLSNEVTMPPARGGKKISKNFSTYSMSVPPCLCFKYFHSGCAPDPFTSTLENISNSTLKSFTKDLISDSDWGSFKVQIKENYSCNQSINQSIHQSIESINQSINHWINQSMVQSINQSIKRTICWFYYDQSAVAQRTCPANWLHGKPLKKE